MGWLSPRGEQREQPRFGKALYWHFPPPLAVLCLLGVVAAGTGGAGPGEVAGGHPVGMGHAAMGGLFWHPYSRLSHLSFFNFSSAGQTSSSFHAGKCAQPRLLAPCPPPALCPPPTPLTTTTTTRPVTCLCWACRGRVGCGLRGALCHHSTGLHVLRLQAAQPERTVSGGQSRVGGTAVPPPYPCTVLYGKRALRRRVFGASLSALTPCSLSHARLDSPTKSKVIYTAATTENTA